MHNVGHLDTLYVSCGVLFRKWELSVVVLHMCEKTKDGVSAWDSCGGKELQIAHHISMRLSGCFTSEQKTGDKLQHPRRKS